MMLPLKPPSLWGISIFQSCSIAMSDYQRVVNGWFQILMTSLWMSWTTFWWLSKATHQHGTIGDGGSYCFTKISKIIEIGTLVLPIHKSGLIPGWTFYGAVYFLPFPSDPNQRWPLHSFLSPRTTRLWWRARWAWAQRIQDSDASKNPKWGSPRLMNRLGVIMLGN